MRINWKWVKRILSTDYLVHLMTMHGIFATIEPDDLASCSRQFNWIVINYHYRSLQILLYFSCLSLRLALWWWSTTVYASCNQHHRRSAYKQSIWQQQAKYSATAEWCAKINEGSRECHKSNVTLHYWTFETVTYQYAQQWEQHNWQHRRDGYSKRKCTLKI